MNLSKVFLILLSTFSLNTFAATQDEINQLLGFLESTDCKYEHNGTLHNGDKAVEHIKRDMRISLTI